MDKIEIKPRELKSVQVGVRIEPTLYQRLVAASEQAGVSPSEYLRQVLSSLLPANSPRL